MSKAQTSVTDPNGMEWLWVSHWCPTCYNAYPRKGNCQTCPRKSELNSYNKPRWILVGEDPHFEKD